MMYKKAMIVALFGAAKGSETKIAGYEPGSTVTEHNKIDLDQKELESYLGNPPDYDAAKKIYELGANSGAYAEIEVANTYAFEKGTKVDQAGSAATGTVKKVTDSKLTVSYTSTCRVGGTGANGALDASGCFDTTTALNVHTEPATLVTFDPDKLTNKYRNLKGFSTKAPGLMDQQPAYEQAKKFYALEPLIAETTYGDSFVMAALDGTGVFEGVGNDGRKQGIKKGSAYMNVWLYTIREFEDAIDDCELGCNNCNYDGVHAWDEGVAFYTGTLEGTEPGGTGSGKMLYRLAEKRCENFGTCVKSGDVTMSAVNKRLFEIWPLARDELSKGNCAPVKDYKTETISLMSVPLIQGALRYAYKVGVLNDGEKAKAEGAIFASAILGMVHECDSASAATIYKNMKIQCIVENNCMADGFPAVKAAFEKVYTCLGITCEHIGALQENGVVKEGAESCATPPPTASTAPPTPPPTAPPPTPPPTATTVSAAPVSRAYLASLLLAFATALLSF
jgi:hypothetical protein